MWYALSAFCIAALLTWGVRFVMQRIGVVDNPEAESRKIHTSQIALGGGLAIYITMTLFCLWFVQQGVFGEDIEVRYVIGFLLGGFVLMIGGFLDDKYTFSAPQQFIAPIVAAIVVIAFGIGPHEITNPYGGVIRLDRWQVSFGSLGTVVILADALVFLWLMGVMFTTKLLDGLDGLVTGIVSIGALMIYFVSSQELWYQPEVALLALVFAASCLGFLVWNWHPASIFLGEGGSLFTGFMLGTLAIISGAKVATTLLVLGIPILDIARVLYLRKKRKQSIFVGDSEHLHFKLLRSGLNQRQAVLLFYAIALLFGMSTVFLQSSQKVIAVVFLMVLLLLIGLLFVRKEETR